MSKRRNPNTKRSKNKKHRKITTKKKLRISKKHCGQLKKQVQPKSNPSLQVIVQPSSWMDFIESMTDDEIIRHVENEAPSGILDEMTDDEINVIFDELMGSNW
jgi:hypothetical protein